MTVKISLVLRILAETLRKPRGRFGEMRKQPERFEEFATMAVCPCQRKHGLREVCYRDGDGL